MTEIVQCLTLAKNHLLDSVHFSTSSKSLTFLPVMIKFLTILDTQDWPLRVNDARFSLRPWHWHHFLHAQLKCHLYLLLTRISTYRSWSPFALSNSTFLRNWDIAMSHSKILLLESTLVHNRSIVLIQSTSPVLLIALPSLTFSCMQWCGIDRIDDF